MITLMVLACLAAEPKVCAIHTVATFETPVSCAVTSMPAAAKWAGEHPKWKIKMLKCAKLGLET